MKPFRETMIDVEARMETRVRGADEAGSQRHENRTTDNMVYAAFVHTVSRPIDGIPDPHYHIHGYVFNATFDRVEKRWKAGQFMNLKADAPFLEAAFNAEPDWPKFEESESPDVSCDAVQTSLKHPKVPLAFNTEVFAYVLTSLVQRNGRFFQRGCGPNFQGDRITLCTCMHEHATGRAGQCWRSPALCCARALKGRDRLHTPRQPLNLVCLGLTVLWSFGPLARRSFGSLGQRTIGPVNQRAASR
jgi:TrwC relaxase